jgi:hypothetical protein
MSEIKKTKTKNNTYGFGVDEKRLEWFRGMEGRVKEIFKELKKARKVLQDGKSEEAIKIFSSIEKTHKRLLLDMTSFRTTVYGQGTGSTGKKRKSTNF